MNNPLNSSIDSIIFELNFSDVPVNTVKVLSNDNLSIIVANLNNEFYAVENVCSHQKVPLNSTQIVNDEEIECQKHGARFNLKTGKQVCLPAVKPIKAYCVKTVQDKVLICEKS